LDGLLQRLPQHLARFACFFHTGNRSVLETAGTYLSGLYTAERSNRLSMTERVCDTDHQRFQQMITDSPWDYQGVVKAVGKEISAALGEDAALIIDESGFTKKGDHSVGVARQYNGRLGKVDNC
jgi:SRSO17 transposase